MLQETTQPNLDAFGLISTSNNQEIALGFSKNPLIIKTDQQKEKINSLIESENPLIDSNNPLFFSTHRQLFLKALKWLGNTNFYFKRSENFYNEKKIRLSPFGLLTTALFGKPHPLDNLEKVTPLAERLDEYFWTVVETQTAKNKSSMKHSFLIENPSSLVAITLIIIAFFSRDLEGKSLSIFGHSIKEKEMNEQNTNHIKYFQDACKLKNAIQNLNLSFNDDTAWATLKSLLKKIGKKTSSELNDITTTNVEFLMDYSMEIAKIFTEETPDVLTENIFKSYITP